MYLIFSTPRKELPTRLDHFRGRAKVVYHDWHHEFSQWYIELEHGSKEYALLVDTICDMDMDLWEISADEAADYGFIDLEEENFLPLLCSLLNPILCVTGTVEYPPEVYARLKAWVESIPPHVQVAADREAKPVLSNEATEEHGITD